VITHLEMIDYLLGKVENHLLERQKITQRKKQFHSEEEKNEIVKTKPQQLESKVQGSTKVNSEETGKPEVEKERGSHQGEVQHSIFSESAPLGADSAEGSPKSEGLSVFEPVDSSVLGILFIQTSFSLCLFNLKTMDLYSNNYNICRTPLFIFNG
jgi:hypothetical protein